MCDKLIFQGIWVDIHCFQPTFFCFYFLCLYLIYGDMFDIDAMLFHSMSGDKNLMHANSVYKGCNFVIWGQISWKCHLALHCVFFCFCSSLQIGGTKWQDINFILSLVMKITHNIIKSDVKSVTFSAYLSSVIWMILPFRNITLWFIAAGGHTKEINFFWPYPVSLVS